MLIGFTNVAQGELNAFTRRLQEELAVLYDHTFYPVPTLQADRADLVGLMLQVPCMFCAPVWWGSVVIREYHRIMRGWLLKEDASEAARMREEVVLAEEASRAATCIHLENRWKQVWDAYIDHQTNWGGDLTMHPWPEQILEDSGDEDSDVSTVPLQ